MNREQLAAVEAPGLVFVSAGAGTGKTTVLVERYVRALVDQGVDVESILVVTYTERAAGELWTRIRARLLELDRPDLARDLDRARISTIHGFCNRLLRTHPFAAGLDPRFRVLDESQARVIRGEAFRAALADFCAGGDPARVGLLATYRADGLRRMLISAYETLRSAGRDLVLEAGAAPDLGAAVDALRSAARCVVDEDAREEAAALLELLGGGPETEELVDLDGFKIRGRGRDRFESYHEALDAVEQAARDGLAERDRALLQDLLTCFDEAYRDAKDRESAVDFEDLQLRARDLLRANEVIRERERWRLRSIMVDEFQDTNRLQCELIDLLAPDDLFFVGDEFQSIYRFRHADVEVFRERRERSGGVLALTENYRSRPEVLRVINHLFGADFGDSFKPLTAAGRFSDPAFGPAVELLVTDKDSYSGTGTHWRSGEAAHVARRVRELVDTGEATPGEIVLLFAAGTDARRYEDALRAEGLPTFRATGRDYYSRQQVLDLLAYLRLAHNRYDDESLVAVLASPLVGVSNDALYLLRKAAPRRPLYTGIERGVPGIGGRDEQLFRAFRQRYERIAEHSGRLSLEQLLEQIVVEHDYDLAVLAREDGRRRYANMRKLGRLARSYEELRGRDLEGFARFAREQGIVGAAEVEAVAEEEGTDVIRLLTIHAAKGLEFKVVVVADAGRERGPGYVDEVLALPDGRLGFKVAHPETGKRLEPSGWRGLKEAEERADREERRRLYYVAMTRAIDRLIVSGSLSFDSAADTDTPIGWVLDRLGAEELERADSGPVEIVRDEARLLLHVDKFAPPQVAEPGPPAAESQLALFAAAEDGVRPLEAPVLPELAPVPEPPLYRARRLSYSALALYELCSYRFYAERIAGMRVRRPGELTAEPGLAATEVGDAVHFLLERVDLAAPAVPADSDDLVRSRYPGARDDELVRIRDFVASYCESDLARRVAGLVGAAPERPFAFEHDGVLLHGFIDVLQLAERRALVVDYKTNALGDASPADIVDAEYRIQRLVYALVCFRAGAEEVEVVYQFLERPDELVSQTYSLADLPGLERELSLAIARIQRGEFSPMPSEFACGECPALDVVCAGPRLRGAAASPAATAVTA